METDIHRIISFHFAVQINRFDWLDEIARPGGDEILNEVLRVANRKALRRPVDSGPSFIIPVAFVVTLPARQAAVP
jgi:hypothetical protein